MTSIINKTKSIIKKHKAAVKKYASYAVYALISGFLISSGFMLFAAQYSGADILDISSVNTVVLSMTLISSLIVAALLFALFIIRKRLYRCCVPLSVLFFSLIILFPSTTASPYFYLVLAAAAALSALALKDVFKDRKINLLEGRNLYIVIGCAAAFMTFTVSFGTIMRMRIFSNSAFDFGLFAQMYEYMASDLTQNTTLERNELMSHFAVHFSPVYYLLLPFYMIFRSPEALLAMQAAVCFSGVIPLLLLCKKWGYSGAVTLAVSGIFLCYPAFTGGCFYDFHENCFLPPLILWTLYFLEANKRIGAIIAGFLLLCVKEDAGLYLIFIALYGLFNKRSGKLTPIILLIAAVLGFVLITGFIESYGEGIKVSRYRIYLTAGQDSLTDVVINVIKNPAFFLSKLFSEQKLLFIMQMLLPLLFIPVTSRKISDWLLMIPFILINLATEYAYQSDINFQYVFGSGAILVFLAAKNLRYRKARLKTAAAAFMAAAICLMGNAIPKYHYADVYFKNQEKYQAAEEVLRKIPRDKVIYACSFLTPHLYDCKELYMYPPIYNEEDWLNADYVIIDTRYYSDGELEQELLNLTENGYAAVDQGSFVTVFAK